MKRLGEYIEETAATIDQPRRGDVLAINIREECLLESSVIDVTDNTVIIDADDKTMAILEQYDMLDEDFESIRAGLERDCDRWYPEAWDRAHQMKTYMDIESALDSAAEDFQDWEEMGTSDRHEACRRVFGYLGIDPRPETGGLEVEPTAEGDISQLEKDIADAPVKPIAAMESARPADVMRGLLDRVDEMFYFDIEPSQDRGPRDYSRDELARRAELHARRPNQPFMGKYGQEYKQKDRYGDMYDIAGPKGPLPEGEEDDLGGDPYEMGYRAAALHHRSRSSNPFEGVDEAQAMEWDAGWQEGAAEEGLDEAEYQGRNVELNKPRRGGTKKFYVYVKDPKTGNIRKISFGDPNMKIKKSNPDRRRSFRARHNCKTAKDKTTARYWSCRAW